MNNVRVPPIIILRGENSRYTVATISYSAGAHSHWHHGDIGIPVYSPLYTAGYASQACAIAVDEMRRLERSGFDDVAICAACGHVGVVVNCQLQPHDTYGGRCSPTDTSVI